MARKKAVETKATQELIEEVATIEEAGRSVYRVKAGVQVNIRKEPSMDAPIIRHTTGDEFIYVHCVKDGWLELEDGSFTMAKYWEKQDVE